MGGPPPPCSHLMGGVARQQLGGFVGRALQPCVEFLLRDDHRHPIVELGHHRIRVGRDERTAVDDVVVLPPGLPEAGHRERLLVAHRDVGHQGAIQLCAAGWAG